MSKVTLACRYGDKRCLETALKETSGLMLYYRPVIVVMVVLGLVKITLELYEA